MLGNPTVGVVVWRLRLQKQKRDDEISYVRDIEQLHIYNLDDITLSAVKITTYLIELEFTETERDLRAAFLRAQQPATLKLKREKTFTLHNTLPLAPSILLPLDFVPGRTDAGF